MADNKKNRGRRPYYGKGKKTNSNDNPPYPQYETCIALEKAVEDNMSEETLVRAVAISWNKYAWYGEKESKLEEKDENYTIICENADAWFEEYGKISDKLKTFLGYQADATFALPEITAEMNKYNYSDDDGIWRKGKQ